jgi:hypothetical protein
VNSKRATGCHGRAIAYIWAGMGWVRCGRAADGRGGLLRLLATAQLLLREEGTSDH